MTPRTADGPRITLVVNPASGGGRARRHVSGVCDVLLRTGATLQVHESTSYADARELCTRAVAAARPAEVGRRADTLVVMGGDGMMHLGLNACAESGVPLGLIPAGTGNDLCRGLGLPLQPEAAARVVVAGDTRDIDLTRVEGSLSGGARQRWVGAVVSTGYDSLVNRRANAIGLPLGSLTYAYAALAELAVFEPLPYRLVVDGAPREHPAMLVAVANSGRFGGGMIAAPGYDVADGLLDLTIIHPVSRMTLLRLLPSMFTGGFVKDPAVERLRAREVVVDGPGLFGMGDGEELGPVPLRLTAVPDALRVHAPTTASRGTPAS